MDTPLNSFSAEEQATLKSIAVELPPRDGMDLTTKEWFSRYISALERRLVVEPANTLLWYRLGEAFAEVQDYVQCLRANQRCYELEPLNPRVIYGLGTAYYKLSHAVFIGNFRYWSIAYATRDEEGEFQVPDPNVAQAALEQLGMTADVAAQHAFTYFSQVRQIASIREEKQHLDLLLKGLKMGFPHVVAPRQASEQKGMNWLARLFALAAIGTIVAGVVGVVGVAVWFYVTQLSTPANTGVAVATAIPRPAEAVAAGGQTNAAPPPAPAPLLTDAPQPTSVPFDQQGLTREEGDYFSALIALQIDIDVAMTAITEQFEATWDDSSVVDSNEWKSRVTGASVDFQNANLEAVNLSHSNLQRTSFVGARLQRADLSYADLRGADLFASDFRDANLRGADLRGATLIYSQLEGADLLGAVRSLSTTWPDGFDFEAAGVLFVDDSPSADSHW